MVSGRNTPQLPMSMIIKGSSIDRKIVSYLRNNKELTSSKGYKIQDDDDMLIRKKSRSRIMHSLRIKGP